MFGAGLSVPIPDLDRTDYLLILGANPLASNGSLMTAPDVRGRLRRIRERGGKVVVVDPRRSRTAEVADEHHFIRPGRDAHLLAGVAHTILTEGLAEPGQARRAQQRPRRAAGAARRASRPRRSRRSAASTPPRSAGSPASWRRRRRAAVYGRIGTTTQEYGTLASWLVDVAQRADRQPRPRGRRDVPAGGGRPDATRRASPARAAASSSAASQSRVRGLGETFGELPVACLAEEIETPGEGQVRALLTVAGNPVVSTPNSDRLRARDRVARLHGLDRLST